MDEAKIKVNGAREHNLKEVDLEFPRNSLVVFTGLSGSGKSSLAFDTIYAEGQRRYLETFSSYIRGYIGSGQRPDVDKIEGLSPVISIEQKTTGRSPRSTVGTITEIYDHLRLLYARVGTAYSHVTGKPMSRYTDDQIVDLIMDTYADQKLVLLAPLVKGRKGHYRELFEQVRKQGYLRVRVDGKVRELEAGMKLERYKIHDIELVVDRLVANKDSRVRLLDSVQKALYLGKGSMLVMDQDDEVRHYSSSLMCADSGISYPEPEPNLFSFNSPYGACKRCNGLGQIPEIDSEKMVPDNKLSIKGGAIAPLGKLTRGWGVKQIGMLLDANGFGLNTPVKEFDDELLNKILYGFEELLADDEGNVSSVSFEGVGNFIIRHLEENPSAKIKRWAGGFVNKVRCPQCGGSRLREEARYFKVVDRSIDQLVDMDFLELQEWVSGIEKGLSASEKKIAKEIVKELNARLGFIVDVGLTYLSLNRPARSLSGGEAQRIRLATQIGSKLVNVLYILDEPSIGLHARDNSKLISALEDLRDQGNSVLVVEHDREMMEFADFIVDIGPGAGLQGGQIVDSSTPKKFIKGKGLTAKYLRRELDIFPRDEVREGNGKFLELKGAEGNNLQKVNLKLPLGMFVCVTGVSGSGKSTLINETLYPILNAHFFNGVKHPMPYKSIKGLEHLDKVVDIDQSPIGRTPRSNPATYTGLFTDIRNLFAQTTDAKIAGFGPGRFSFNVKGGRCEHCKGAGVEVIEMNFLPDVMVTCPECMGRRYNRETLKVRYRGMSIGDVLDLSISKAAEVFESVPKIKRRLDTLCQIGMGYVKLGQPSTTLSGGEAQRIKLATELSKRSTGKTLYIMDEPSTGLHFEDIRLLMKVIHRLADEGNTVLVIEHNMDIIKNADHIIDMGPEGGRDGGKVICQGSPQAMMKHAAKSYTAKYLKEEFQTMKKHGI